MGRPRRPAADVVDGIDDPMVDDLIGASGGPGVPMMYEEPAAFLKKVYEAAAVNAQPPVFAVPVGKPEWNGSAGGWALGVAIFVAVGVGSVAYWLTVVTVWSFLHVLMWLLGHPYRLAAGGVVAGVGYFYLTR